MKTFDIVTYLVNHSKLGRLGALAYMGGRDIHKHDERLNPAQCAAILEDYAIKHFGQRSEWDKDFQWFIALVTGAMRSVVFGNLRSRMWPVGHEGYRDTESLLVPAREELPARVFGEHKGVSFDEEFADHVRRCVIDLIRLTT